MIKRISLVKRAHGLSRDAFEEHWRTRHVELVLRLPGLRGYRINLAGDGAPWDGVGEVWFDSREDCERAFAELADELAADRPQFISEVEAFIVEEVVVLDEHSKGLNR